VRFDHDGEAARERIQEELPHYGSPDLRPVQLAEVYARLAAVSVQRAAFLGRLLAEAYQREGIGALIGVKTDAVVISLGRDAGSSLETYPVSEEVRGLARLEAEERDRAERLAREAIKLGIEARRVDVLRSYGRTVAETIRAFARELGLDWTDPAVRRIAQRAVLAARQSLGFDYRSPEEAGARLSPEERQRLLGTQ
jgi:hypothetical protein